MKTLMIIIFLLLSTTVFAEQTCNDCIGGCRITTRDSRDCNYITCDYKCSVGADGKEHWTTHGYCMNTLMFCTYGFKVEKPIENDWRKK